MDRLDDDQRNALRALADYVEMYATKIRIVADEPASTVMQAIEVTASPHLDAKVRGVSVGVMAMSPTMQQYEVSRKEAAKWRQAG